MVALSKSDPVSPHDPIPPTERDVIDRKLERLSEKKKVWTRISAKERAKILDRLLKDMYEVTDEIGTRVAISSGFDPSEDAAGEFWLSNSIAIMRGIRQLRDAMKANGQPKAKKWQRDDGQWVIRSYPLNSAEKLLFPLTTIDIWVEPGKSPTQGKIYREGLGGDGKVSVILGAGNFASIPALDLLHKLFVENEVALVKMNPVNEACGPALELGFRSLIDAGFADFAYGGTDVGKYLTQHRHVDTIHITGAAESHDAIVWGSTHQEQKKNKAAGTPVITKSISSELGGVGPLIVVPAKVSDKQLNYWAQCAAYAMTLNTGYACAAAKVIVLPRHWDQLDAFRQKVREILARVPPRKAYYPGTEARFDKMMEMYPQAEILGETPDGHAKVALIPDVPFEKGEYALTHESFCTVSCEVLVDSENVEEYMREATRLSNENTYGNLQCTVLCTTQTQKAHAEAFDQMIAGLQFGQISVNIWTGAAFVLMNSTWGAFAGNALDDVQSGVGMVHGTALMVDYPQKSVLKAPNMFPVVPPTYLEHRNKMGLGKGWCRWETNPTMFNMARWVTPELLKA
jgi:acyl-CoA reductase-like NAD-dependent aldehyde dehydrogenase